jgi:hypothetical protein
LTFVELFVIVIPGIVCTICERSGVLRSRMVCVPTLGAEFDERLNVAAFLAAPDDELVRPMTLKLLSDATVSVIVALRLSPPVTTTSCCPV